MCYVFFKTNASLSKIVTERQRLMEFDAEKELDGTAKFKPYPWSDEKQLEWLVSRHVLENVLNKVALCITEFLLISGEVQTRIWRDSSRLLEKFGFVVLVKKLSFLWDWVRLSHFNG